MKSRLIKESLKKHSLIRDTFIYLLYKIGLCNNRTSYNMRCDNDYYKLKRKYWKKLASINNNLPKNHVKSNYVWITWFQGRDNAPEIVKRCIDSIEKELKGKEIVIITDDNYKEYVDFPEFITEKYKKGIITKTHFSDILRMALLKKYGGLWLDATVFCTGNNELREIEQNDIFVYREGWWDHQTINMASWLIYSESNNKFISATLELLYEYWSKHNYLMNYFLVHLLFRMVTEYYPDDWKKIPYFDHSNNHLLAHELSNKYDSKRYERIIKITDFHKLSYKIYDDFDLIKEFTFYDYIMAKNNKGDRQC